MTVYFEGIAYIEVAPNVFEPAPEQEQESTIVYVNNQTLDETGNRQRTEISQVSTRPVFSSGLLSRPARTAN